jgi:hypothetical protein
MIENKPSAVIFNPKWVAEAPPGKYNFSSKPPCKEYSKGTCECCGKSCDQLTIEEARDCLETITEEDGVEPGFCVRLAQFN